ncbi:uncharacterized protein LOC127834715 [Dreissena polymorpha]|uniref:Uncharacterized protein n=1 Tax=Dreissena polymorpha TaxID=45954 RepID=A0A9D4G1S1_DREPO|nr:uncharacterized protein LOC127834715 [Dreissena polymorpha]XP_052216694.1 uncharacterized protein LOC127834715 [Dreissena polymorpha]KAH3807554.1 hypothetical protein DPMN_135899 [Dreissena polymorpha]
MSSKYVLILLELCLTLMVSSSVIKRYQEIPLPVCPQQAVCSEIYGLQRRGLPDLYLNYVKCTCPAGSYCPERPGSQTLPADDDTWFGLCQLVSSLERCANGDVAQEMWPEGPQLNGVALTTVKCVCPRKNLIESRQSSSWTESIAASPESKYVYTLVCSDELQDDGLMTKRGRYGGSGNRGRFYFYK